MYLKIILKITGTFISVDGANSMFPGGQPVWGSWRRFINDVIQQAHVDTEGGKRSRGVRFERVRPKTMVWIQVEYLRGISEIIRSNFDNGTETVGSILDEIILCTSILILSDCLKLYPWIWS